MTPETARTMQIVIPIVVIGIVLAFRVRRMSQMRPLKLETLWIVPAIFVAVFVLTVSTQPPRPAGLDWAWLAPAVVIGAGVGWYRGKMMQIHVDPQTHALNQKASPAALIFLVAVILVRYGLRFEAATGV